MAAASKYVRFLFILGFIVLFNSAKAQQTIFNVPLSDITPEGKVFIQQQVSFEELLESSTTFNYGLRNDWEIGFNLFNVNYNPSGRRFARNDSTTEQPFAPLALANAQKAFQLSELLKIAVGAQGGFNVSPAGKTTGVYYAYTNLGGNFVQEHYKTSAGIYTGNNKYLGDGPRAGLQLGLDAGVVYQKFHLLGEWMSGSHQFGKLSLGADWYVTKDLILALGWQRANKDGSQAAILQISYAPH